MEEKRGTILQSALKYMMHENTFTLLSGCQCTFYRMFSLSSQDMMLCNPITICCSGEKQP